MFWMVNWNDKYYDNDCFVCMTWPVACREWEECLDVQVAGGRLDGVSEWITMVTGWVCFQIGRGGCTLSSTGWQCSSCLGSLSVSIGIGWCPC